MATSFSENVETMTVAVSLPIFILLPKHRFQNPISISRNELMRVFVGITFLLFDIQLHQTLPFHLKAQVEECFNILWQDVKRPWPETKAAIQQQANRTAWKILSDWTEVQCTMILLGQAKPLQMFLPFMYDMKTNETLFDKVSTGKVKLLLGTI